jgi:hypothetical protein
MMFKASQVVTPDREGVKPFGVRIRVTTADFFRAFDVPFLFGSDYSPVKRSDVRRESVVP